jgi:transglutaminase-like putative cysteine protease
MRLSIDHRTRYHFSEAQDRVVQLLRMTPHDFGAQTVLDWSIGVSCDARLREGRDGYGNLTSMLYVEGPITDVEIIVSGEVLTDDHGGLVFGVPETLPPGFFLRQTPLTFADDAITELAEARTGNIADPTRHAGLIAIDTFEHIQVRAGKTPKSRTAGQALSEGWGSVRDKTHVMLAVARASGLPARFVSGHCLDGINVAGHKSAHCWAEIYAEGTGWLALDPCTGHHIGESYVRVAIGLDASDATPLSGTRTGGGMEELDVDVRVALSQSAAQ